MSETGVNSVNFLLILVMLRTLSLPGVAYAYVGQSLFQMLVLLVICRRLTGFKWSADAIRLLLLFSATVGACVAASCFLDRIRAAAVIGMVAMSVSVFCLRQLAVRLGPDHRILRMFARLPLFGRVLSGC